MSTYFCFGVKGGRCYLLSVNRNSDVCETIGRERGGEHSIDVYTVLDFFAKTFKHDLIMWLADNNIVGADADDILRDLQKMILSVSPAS